jgi:hypothetical protein
MHQSKRWILPLEERSYNRLEYYYPASTQTMELDPIDFGLEGAVQGSVKFNI